jgi:hypothetical protein
VLKDSREAAAEATPLGTNLVKLAALRTWEQFKQKHQDRDVELRKKLALQRSKARGWLYRLLMAALPDRLHVYIHYFHSLRCAMSTSELLKNVAVAVGFSLFILPSDHMSRMIQMYHAALAALMTLLMSRNMPADDKESDSAAYVPVAGARERGAMTDFWSANCFLSAAALTALFGHVTAAAAMVPMFLFQSTREWSMNTKVKAAMLLSLFVHAFFSTQFECYERGVDSGMRWKKAKLQLHRQEKYGWDEDDDDDDDFDDEDRQELESMENMHNENNDELDQGTKPINPVSKIPTKSSSEKRTQSLIPDLRALLDRHFGISPVKPR